MPPEIVPSSISALTSSATSPVTTWPCPSKTPAVLVSNISFSALSTSASLPATRSALMLYDSPSAPTPIGATTGITSLSVSIVSTRVSIDSTWPTCPMSMISGASSSGLFRSIFSCFARINCPSLPVSPIARPPARLRRLTISLLTSPPSTISTTSMVSSVVTRIPSINFDSIFNRSSKSPICGPPPCTTIGRIPTACIKTISLANEALRSSSVIAFPPYLTTIVRPANFWM